MGHLQDQLKQLCRTKGLTYVSHRGDPRSRICFVGEAPGADEDQSGIPFTGQSGQELDREIAESGISASDCWFTNPYKTRPPDNKLPRLHELGIDPKMHEAAFWEHLGETKPTIIVTTGQTPTNLLCPETVVKRKVTDEEGISFSHWRGSLLQSPYLNWPHYIVPIYHPAFILRDHTERDINVFILRRVLEEFNFYVQAGKLQPLPERELITQPSAGETINYLRECLQRPNTPHGVDIEMLRRRVPYTVAIADSPRRAVSICFWDYSDADAALILRYLGAFLRKVRQVGQNYTTFDAPWLRVFGVGPKINLVDDTLIRHHVLWPEMSHKLEFQVMQYTREPFFKEEGKGWNPRSPEQKKRMMLYNCKDACTTLEIYNEQEIELDDKGLRKFYTEYEMPLARRYYSIDQRGLFFDPATRRDVLSFIEQELAKNDTNLKGSLGKRIYSTSKVVPKGEERNSYYLLSYSKDVLQILRDSGIKPKKKPFSVVETTDEESLNQLFAETSSPILKQILRGRELTKFKGTYVCQKLYKDISYTNYNVAGTLGGRRSARKNVFGFGSNHQNQPQHGDLAKEYKKIISARPGNIFVYGDQVQAEDWIVNGIIADVSGDRTGLDELLNGVDRHKKLAAFLFGLPESQCGKDTIQRFLGKKVRHAGNYDMREDRMSGALAKEGYDIKPRICAGLLEKFHENNPSIRGVFHKWVESCVTKDRMLRTPFGRERIFFGVHPYRNNSKLFKEAYSYVPQSTVGDNTGQAVLVCEDRKEGWLVNEKHDSLTLEVPFDFNAICEGLELLQIAFNRTIHFPNGLEIQIPIEHEIGFTFGTQIKCANSSEAGLKNIWDTLSQQASLRTTITTGQQPQS